jgi:hypothetical protein
MATKLRASPDAVPRRRDAEALAKTPPISPAADAATDGKPRP